jgi:DNA-binding LacI/PurR family transcriptional regulator
MIAAVRQRRVGIKDVAIAAGVSATTVSHALNGKGRLPPGTRERVHRIAEELGYRPNATARHLAGGKTGVLALAVSPGAGTPDTLSDFAYFMQLMTAATAAAFERGYALVLAPAQSDGARWLSVDIDGAIVIDPVPDDPQVQALRDREAPVVTTGRVPGEEAASPWVDNDHGAATRSVLDHLARRGARRIALVMPPATISYVLDVRTAYAAWCAARGAEPLIAVAGKNLTEGAGYLAGQELLELPERPDAIYATLDRLALGVLLAAQAKGVRVPVDMLVAGNTDSEAGRWARPSLTALNLHPEQIGHHAVELLVDLVEGRQPANPRILVPTRLIARGSTRRTVTPR